MDKVAIDPIEVMTRAIKHGLIENDEDTEFSVNLVEFGQEMFTLGVTRTAAAWFGTILTPEQLGQQASPERPTPEP